MKKRLPVAAYILIILFSVGLVYSFFKNPLTILIPAVVFGIIFLLYKYPPKRFQRSGDSYKYRTALKKQKEKRKKAASLRVIRGNKGKSGPDEPPKYH